MEVPGQWRELVARKNQHVHSKTAKYHSDYPPTLHHKVFLIPYFWRSLSLGQMLQPTKELLKELSQTHGLTRKLEELTNDEKVNELEEIWKRVAEERKTLDFQDVADWM